MARDDSAFAQRMSASGFDVYRFKGKGWSPRAVSSNRRVIRQWRPDVLHLNDSHAVTAGALASMGRGLKRVAARRVLFPIRSAWRYRLVCHQLICVSRAVADVCHRCGIPELSTSVVYEGIDPSDLGVNRADTNHAEDDGASSQETIVVLAVAALTEEKGHRFLLDAMRQVRHHAPHVSLLLAGDGPLRDSLQQQARRLGIERAVTFLGFRQDIPDLLRAADLLVMPSIAEGLGTSLIDAMLCRTPIVATAAGGIPELFAQENAEPPLAWLVPPGNAEALAEAIRQACASKNERLDRARRAALHAARRFTADNMVDATLEVYRRLVA